MYGFYLENREQRTIVSWPPNEQRCYIWFNLLFLIRRMRSMRNVNCSSAITSHCLLNLQKRSRPHSVSDYSCVFRFTLVCFDLFVNAGSHFSFGFVVIEEIYRSINKKSSFADTGKHPGLLLTRLSGFSKLSILIIQQRKSKQRETNNTCFTVVNF